MMTSQEKITKNLRTLRIGKGLTQENLSDFLGLSSSQYSNYEQGTRAVPIDVLVSVSAYYQIALDALIKYDLSKVDIKGLMKVGDNRLLFPIFISESGKYESIEIVPVKASAGYLKGYADPEFLEALPKMELPFFGPGSYRGFQIDGDSMIPIPSGSHIVGRYVEDLNEIKDGKTYIVITNEGITYKRVINRIEADGTLHLIPYNKYYKTVFIKAEEVIELWAFQCFISTKEYKDEELITENFLPALSSIGNGIEEIKSLIKQNQL